MILFALALLASSPADAPVAPALAPVVATPASAPHLDDMDKMVCHVDPETGTRLGTHKVCHTMREWIQNQTEQASYLDQQTAISHPLTPH